MGVLCLARDSRLWFRRDYSTYDSCNTEYTTTTSLAHPLGFVALASIHGNNLLAKSFRISYELYMGYNVVLVPYRTCST